MMGLIQLTLLLFLFIFAKRKITPMVEISFSQAQALLKMEKVIVNGDDDLQGFAIDLSFPIDISVDLLSSDGEYSFRWVIYQSAKDCLKINLHFMEDDSKTGLLRIDISPWNVKHSNPIEINDDVPSPLVPYAGKEIAGSHVHYCVKGYRQLVWALPITESEMMIPSLEGHPSQEMVGEVLYAFASFINIKTKLILEPPIL